MLLLLTYTLVATTWLSNLGAGVAGDAGLPSTTPTQRWQTAYCLGLAALDVYANLLHSLVLGADRLPFLPLMATSIYCRLAWGALFFLGGGGGSHNYRSGCGMLLTG